MRGARVASTAVVSGHDGMRCSPPYKVLEIAIAVGGGRN
eukprot:gene39812-28429_t